MGRKVTDQSLVDRAREHGERLRKAGIEDDYKPRGKPIKLNIPEEPKKFNERDFYHHVKGTKEKLDKMTAKEKEEFEASLESLFDNKENLVKYVRAVLPEKMDKGMIIQNIYLEKKGFKTKDEIDKYIRDNKLIKNKSTLKSKIEKLINEIMETKNPQVKSHDTSDDVLKAIFKMHDIKLSKKQIDTTEPDKLIKMIETKMKPTTTKKEPTIEPIVKNYVAKYKELLTKDNKGGARTKAINKHISNFMQVARPSEISSANKLIKQLKDAQTKTVG